jgi:hypothetical protein
LEKVISDARNGALDKPPKVEGVEQLRLHLEVFKIPIRVYLFDRITEYYKDL